MQHQKFPKIPSFANLVKKIRLFHDKRQEEYPIISYEGVTKLHGTNSCIIRANNNNFYYQSRNRMITPAKDNAGFAQWCNDIDDNEWHILFNRIQNYFVNKTTLHPIKQNHFDNRTIRIFGEFVGKGIQESVAISRLPKSFFIFSIYIDDIGWIVPNIFSHLEIEKCNIHNVYQYQTWNIEIDFKYPERALKHINTYTKKVGDQCPISKEFGIEGSGEGICWLSTDFDYPNLRFKSKDEKFQEVSRKPKGQKEVSKFQQFVESCITEGRFTSIFNQMREMDIELTPHNTREAIKILANDVYEEERITLEGFGATLKDVNKAVSRMGGKMYNRLINEVF